MCFLIRHLNVSVFIGVSVSEVSLIWHLSFSVFVFVSVLVVLLVQHVSLILFGFYITHYKRFQCILVLTDLA